MAVTTVALSSGYNAALAFGSYNITKFVLNAAAAQSVTFFDSDDTDRAVVHAATVSIATSLVDKYTYYQRSTVAGEEGRPILQDTPGVPSGQSIEVPIETAPATTDIDDAPALNDYVTTTGTTQTEKFTGITATSTPVTANSVTVLAFGGLSAAAGVPATWTPAGGVRLSRGLVVNSTGTATLDIYY